jgi:hypothetical protein
LIAINNQLSLIAVRLAFVFRVLSDNFTDITLDRPLQAWTV